jgi:hypothetical protein
MRRRIGPQGLSHQKTNKQTNKHVLYRVKVQDVYYGKITLHVAGNVTREQQIM